MLIVDGQTHLWENGAPLPQRRQEPYSAEQACRHGIDRLQRLDDAPANDRNRRRISRRQSQGRLAIQERVPAQAG
jgi:hypothetical protein